MKKILLIDNYDSFTYNIVQYLAELGAKVEVVVNDSITVKELLSKRPSGLVISPGPGRPEDAGVSIEAVRGLCTSIPVLGVCLGHQCIGTLFGGRIVNARRIMHGKLSSIRHNGKGIFKGLKNPFNATRYHSLAIAADSFPPELEITARSEDGEIMGITHKRFAIFGVQFHPESILTEQGHKLINNFLSFCKG